MREDSLSALLKPLIPGAWQRSCRDATYRAAGLGLQRKGIVEMSKAKSRPPRLVPERRRAFTELVEQKGSVRVAALSSMFGVTEETIRRDLEELEQDGLLKRTYGGAVAVGGRGSSLE